MVARQILHFMLQYNANKLQYLLINYGIIVIIKYYTRAKCVVFFLEKFCPVSIISKKKPA